MPKMSSPDSAKSSHEALLVDGELVSGKSTFLLGEICERIRESSLLQSGPRGSNSSRASRSQQRP